MARLRDEEDFVGLFAVASEVLGLPSVVVEKDYWVTQALRGLADAHGHEVIFKGGTSLSKGYGLIERFSEDIDILVIRADGEAAASIDARLKRMGEAAAAAVGGEADRRHSGRGVHRTVGLTYPRQQGDESPVLPFVLLEMGVHGGVRPAGDCEIATMIGDVLIEQGQTELGEYDDLEPFAIPTLHPGRTLIEKLLLVNSVVAAAEGDVSQIERGRIGRHFYDIHCLLGSDQVLELLQERAQFEEITSDAIEISRRHYEGAVDRPEDSFAGGPAFTASGELRDALEREYATALDAFYFGQAPYPSFAEVIERVVSSAELL